MRRILSVFLSLSIVIAAFGLLYAQSADHSIFQVSTFHALKQGKYDGETTFEVLKKQGDFGLGTVNGLDGEVLALNGEFFQIKADGRVYSIAEHEKTPFAVVTFFKPDKRLSLPLVSDMKELQETLDRMLPSGGRHRCNKNCRRIQIRKGPKRTPAGKAVPGT